MWKTLKGDKPRVIAHRGASGYRPEHTLEGYALAVDQCADVIEPDLVPSRDGVLYARHDLGLARSTNIVNNLEFAARARTVNDVRDWWIDDFLAHELDTLRAVQPFPLRDAQYDGQFSLPRFGRVLDLILKLAQTHRKPIGIYPEIKHPNYFRALGVDPVAAFVDELRSRELQGPDSVVWLQCFDHAVLREMKEALGNSAFALVEQLPDMPLGAWFKQLHWADGIAVSKALLWDAQGRDRGLVASAHTAGLAVHAWTFREDRSPAPFVSSYEELHAAYSIGVDALFCDFPDCAVSVRDTLEWV